MEEIQVRKNCESCLLIRPPHPDKERKEGIIKMDKYWFLNHYYGIEGFLGWLALSPISHKEELSDLCSDEACALGRHIVDVEKALKAYWSDPLNKEKFRNDTFWKIYVIYFSESRDYHLHFHLIPRTKKFSGSFSSCKPAWETPKMTKCWDDFPEEYRIRTLKETIKGKSKPDENGMAKIKDLMASIKEYLKKDWLIDPK